MKKTFLSALLLASASSALFAQVSFGPKIGLGISTFTHTKAPANSSKQSYNSIITPQVGVVLNAQLGDLFAIRPELLFLQRGAKSEGSSSFNFGGSTIVNSYKITSRISYLELPVNAVLGGKVGPGRLEGFFGPAFGLALGGKTKSESTSNNKTTTTDITIKAKKDPDQVNDNNGYVNPLNVSLNFGLDYKFENGFLIQAGYNLGLSNIDPHHSDANEESDRKNDIRKASSVNFAVGFLFGGK